MAASGIDGIQAIEIAMRLIGARLYTSAHHEAGTLIFEKPGAGYGFPVPQEMRDVLVGDDVRFF